MPAQLDVILLECHEEELRRLLHRDDGHEAAAYVLFGKAEIAADPWTGTPRRRLVSHRVVPIVPLDFKSASAVHVTWDTGGFMRLLGEAKERNLVAGIAHTHPGGPAFFSTQDDANERELARTAFLKGVPLASLVFGVNGAIAARLWDNPASATLASSLTLLGASFQIRRAENLGGGPAFLARQATLFGLGFNPLGRSLRIAVVGVGGTGSAVAMLLARLGVGYLALIDRDIISETNLNRVHGSRAADVRAALPKVDILAREISAAGLGVQVITRRAWVGDPSLRDLLRSCDAIMGCTDDHQGRVTLNRFSHFYGVPVFDVGLRMRSAKDLAAFDMVGRVTVVRPGAPCLLCQGTVNLKQAADEGLRRIDPDEFERRKAEAYVADGGDPAPAVVTFTTSVAAMGVDELIHGLTGFKRTKGMVHTCIRRFDRSEDRSITCQPSQNCPVCGTRVNWGRGDTTPFLGVIG
jgi:molybdopterin/thiamine biosynthesis adenylyltransferase